MTDVKPMSTLKFLLLVFLAAGFAFLFFSALNRAAQKARGKRFLKKADEAAAAQAQAQPTAQTAAPAARATQETAFFNWNYMPPARSNTFVGPNGFAKGEPNGMRMNGMLN